MEEAYTEAALQSASKPQLAYLANFHHGSYDPSVDKLALGSLKEGSAGVPDSFPTWTPKDGAVELKVTKPSAASELASAGLFVTGGAVDFGPGSYLDIQATFVAPRGPQEAGVLWAVTIQARTGGTADLGTETRAAVTFQVRGPAARMNVRGIVGTAREEIPPATYDAIFAADPKPFTLQLIVDRISGKGSASFKCGGVHFTKDVTFAAFKENSGPAITAIGATLAIDTADHETASVEVREFRITAPTP